MGPHTWENHWPIATTPQYGQSPIDIQSHTTVPSPDDWKPLNVKVRPNTCTRLHNNGHSVQVDVTSPGEGDADNDYNLRHGPLSDDFSLAQFHFHWGRHDNEGSEHTVDGTQYAGEVHFVHYNKSKFASASKAIDKFGGIAVLGVLLKVGRKNPGLQKLIDLFDQIPYKGEEVTLKEGFNITQLLPHSRDMQKYWHYYGSLTTPPLYESVNWLVFQKPQEVSTEQLAAFRRLHSHARGTSPETSNEFHGKIECNFRPPQLQNFIRRSEDGKQKLVERVVYSAKVKSRSGQGLYVSDSEEDSRSRSSMSSDSDDEE